MKHTIQLKLPKLFGKKKEDGTEVTTEMNLENKGKEIIIGVLVVGLVTGYLIGHYRGVNKTPPNMYIIK